MDMSGIEPDTSRSQLVLSERDNQLHHVPLKIRPLSFTFIWLFFSHALPPCEARPLGGDTLIGGHPASSEAIKALQIQQGPAVSPILQSDPL